MLWNVGPCIPALAAALSPEFSQLDDKIENVGVIVCGGNVDIAQLGYFLGDNCQPS